MRWLGRAGFTVRTVVPCVGKEGTCWALVVTSFAHLRHAVPHKPVQTLSLTFVPKKKLVKKIRYTKKIEKRISFFGFFRRTLYTGIILIFRTRTGFPFAFAPGAGTTLSVCVRGTGLEVLPWLADGLAVGLALVGGE